MRRTRLRGTSLERTRATTTSPKERCTTRSRFKDAIEGRRTLAENTQGGRSPEDHVSVAAVVSPSSHCMSRRLPRLFVGPCPHPSPRPSPCPFLRYGRQPDVTVKRIRRSIPPSPPIKGATVEKVRRPRVPPSLRPSVPPWSTRPPPHPPLPFPSSLLSRSWSRAGRPSGSCTSRHATRRA